MSAVTVSARFSDRVPLPGAQQKIQSGLSHHQARNKMKIDLKKTTVEFIQLSPRAGSKIHDVICEAILTATTHRTDVCFTFNDRKFRCKLQDLVDVIFKTESE